jgi:dTDP-4-amino-4,6-dideoxygalactose transaminase
MGNLNAAIGLEQMKRFDAFCKRRQAIAGRYEEALAGVPGLALREQRLQETCPFFYVVRVLDGRREALISHLKEIGVMTGVHYVPNHLHQLFADRRTSLPVAERLGQEILTLPLFFKMTDEQVEFVIAGVRRFFCGAPQVVSVESKSHSAAGTQQSPRRSVA